MLKFLPRLKVGWKCGCASICLFLSGCIRIAQKHAALCLSVNILILNCGRGPACMYVHSSESVNSTAKWWHLGIDWIFHSSADVLQASSTCQIKKEKVGFKYVFVCTCVSVCVEEPVCLCTQQVIFANLTQLEKATKAVWGFAVCA